jgi:hypothetical protein
LLFWGANPLYQEETKDTFLRWKVFFDAFLISRDARYGNLLHLPFGGGVFEQPSKTMNVITFIQSLYIEKLEYENKKSMEKIKQPRRR